MTVRFPVFEETLSTFNLNVDRRPTTTVQVNLGKICNQACLHCHVEAGPKRTEAMTLKTAERVLELVSNSSKVQTVDVTGGAPEINDCFRPLVEKSRALGKSVIDRCNLTIFFEEGQLDLPQFLAQHSVHVVASLPCYTKENVDTQRGGGAFEKSIRGLRMLNELGYGDSEGLKLDLVYNPLGATLPPSQVRLENDYKERLYSDFGIKFNNLITITNMPIKRFKHQLEQWGQLEEYQELLVQSFNPATANGLMCRDLVSVDWRGNLFDCDFNQMEKVDLGGERRTIWDINSFDELYRMPIAFAQHCYGCTAGAGSSCQGSLAS